MFVHVKLEQRSGELVGVKFVGFHHIAFYRHDAIRRYVVEITLLGNRLRLSGSCHASSKHQRREESVKFIHICDLFFLISRRSQARRLC